MLMMYGKCCDVCHVKDADVAVCQVKDADADDVWQDPLAWALRRKDYDDKDTALTGYWRSIYHIDDRHVASSKFYDMRLGQALEDFKNAREALAGRSEI